MKKHLIILITVVMLIGCNNKSQLNKTFNCGSANFNELTTNSDFNKNFTIKIPSNWKTNLYYDQNQSELFAADTTKQLSKSYIIDVAYNYGSINLNEPFIKSIDSTITSSKLTKLKSGKTTFKNKPSFWYLSNGTKKGFTYHQLNLIIKVSNTAYITCYSQIYGEKNIDERICESISLFDNIDFLQ
ncbi:hypothetical protein [uncultured Lutibacter sp.]|uniref:hypothetical protein n=1 Tax=uncultured Lutibacter sp. TaxID=437739 RepID=UPI002608A779|nr:hypothetical protein [uncultured Lutibacter sp.]